MPRGQPHYYDASGRSWTPAISRHPANYTRISSSFSLHRMDPAVHFVHPHYGVDMAAPAGTPVHAAAEGMVKFVGRARGYGKLVELRHSDGYTTRYAHLDRFARHLHDGQHVAQGEKIGTVGNTGWSTGPHLLFEIRKNGVPHNPMTMPLPDGQPLDNQRRARFKRRIRALIVQLDHPRAGSITLTSLVVAPGCRRFAQLNARLALDPAAYKLEQLPQNFLCLLRGPLRNHRAPLASKPQSKRPVFE